MTSEWTCTTLFALTLASYRDGAIAVKKSNKKL
uniref:Uncharacterized protein n=1 Tax=Siphoviridae sp. ctv838 TaxID=2827964 RepID=A0A8S5SRY8_9CAUD|nr:MAG TPA: hypothetical protein [Siphoviridae sp. ctv838]